MKGRSSKKKFKAQQTGLKCHRPLRHQAGSLGYFPPLPYDGGMAYLGPTAGYGLNSCRVPDKPHFNSIFLCIEITTLLFPPHKIQQKLLSCKHIYRNQSKTGLQSQKQWRGRPQTIRIQIYTSNYVPPSYKNCLHVFVLGQQYMKNS